MEYLLGYDIGSSSVKAALLEASTGICRASAFSPSREMPISSPQPGWAEQDPEMWWKELTNATNLLRSQTGFKGEDLIGIGISYQMHGLVCVSKEGQVLRPAIIWCDSRAVTQGRRAEQSLGTSFCLGHYLNSPGNFTASKLAWVKENEPSVYDRIHRILLPGDYIALRLTGEMTTTIPGLSEGIFWDFSTRSVAAELLDFFGIDRGLLAPVRDSFSVQGRLIRHAAEELGLTEGVPVTYRAGDQPNNAYALQALEPGEVAAAAGTSGVIYGISDQPAQDPRSRVNAFVHVTDQPKQTRIGMLMCINGCGILYGWLRRLTGAVTYEEMNRGAARVAPGSDGLLCIPFGNGAERILENRVPGAGWEGLDLNRHGSAHLWRAGQEGVGYAFRYGLDILKATGTRSGIIRAAHANLFLSPVFREIFVQTTGSLLELYDTDGAAGAARAAGVGAGYYSSFRESFTGMRKMAVLEPVAALSAVYQDGYGRWLEALNARPAMQTHI